MTTNCQAIVTDEGVTSGLDTLVCAIDGARPESYSRYRVHGDFELAVRFMSGFAERRRVLGATTRIVWKYVLFRHNSSEDEIREAQRLAVEAGVDELRFVLTRNGPAAEDVAGAEDLPRPPDGLLQTFERHEPDPLDLAARIDEAEGLSASDHRRAQELVLSVARNLARFFPHRLPDRSPHRETVSHLMTVASDLPAPTADLVRDLVGHLDDHRRADPAEGRSTTPDPSDVAHTVELVRQARRYLGYAPLVTGLRPLYQDHRLLFPQFVTGATGCFLTDTCGRRMIDWMSGYGSVVLGYGNAEVEAAVTEQLACGPVLPFGHPLEVDVARQLVRLIPCAEAVGFGKNGSDMLTAAVRIARLVTGREVVLFHGYHGFQDWYAAANPRIGGIPAVLRDLVEEFPWNDLRALEELFAQHRGNVAAVVMEPIKQHLPAPGWLEAIRELAHHNGALLIFDEIVTGFRVGLGGAQELFSVVPDLACFGKAMANGWSISALVGRRDLVCRWPEIGVDMTWRAELPSMAAARCVMKILEREDVTGTLSTTGERLRRGFAAIAEELDLPARLTGHPS
ncbi:MAG TPA: aminotransferase class III-fold pyridoxal phosphate-dependent enzyme, partial [Acidobacteria bacterium]|nr:aminotransferase class III-fold pyridoxal phosphate-dependent enzyme [Acidobacteriota bacterium]